MNFGHKKTINQAAVKSLRAKPKGGCTFIERSEIVSKFAISGNLISEKIKYKIRGDN